MDDTRTYEFMGDAEHAALVAYAYERSIGRTYLEAIETYNRVLRHELLETEARLQRLNPVYAR